MKVGDLVKLKSEWKLYNLSRDTIFVLTFLWPTMAEIAAPDLSQFNVKRNQIEVLNENR